MTTSGLTARTENGVRWLVLDRPDLGNSVTRAIQRDIVENLSRAGVTTITPDQGVAMLRALVADPDAPVVAVVTGRFGEMPTVSFGADEPPLLHAAGDVEHDVAPPAPRQYPRHIDDAVHAAVVVDVAQREHAERVGRIGHRSERWRCLFIRRKGVVDHCGPARGRPQP